MSIKSLVAIVMASQTFHVTILMHSCYHYLVSNYLNPQALRHSVWSMLLVPVTTAWITLTSQIFFARRVSLIGIRYRILVAICAIALLAHFGERACAALSFIVVIPSCPVILTQHLPSVGITAFGFRLGSLAAFQEHAIDWLFAAATGAAGVADAVLSTAMILAVRQSRANYQRGDTTYERVMLYVIRSGLLTGIHVVSPMCCRPSHFLSANRGMEIFASALPGRDIFARANRIAAAERWNAPQVPEDVPTKIAINVSAETETHGQCGDESEQDLDGKVLNIRSI
ncbi:hypothetical protein BV20DRAFT_104383 [Pilatotrama ljubarskyi]|nr:hypothetical protein BV20DRAFT_104383 [Pilatotrama ljubarskyi]